MASQQLGCCATCRSAPSAPRREDRCQGYVGHDYIPAVRPTRGITNGGVRNVATVMPSTPRPLVAPSEVLSRGCGRSPAASTTTAPNARL